METKSLFNINHDRLLEAFSRAFADYQIQLNRIIRRADNDIERILPGGWKISVTEKQFKIVKKL